MQDLGQLLITGIDSTTLTAEEKEFIKEYRIGGVLLFSRNYENEEQLVNLINEIQELRHHYPLFIMVDQEGGRVQRFKDPFTIIPPMAKLGALNSPKVVFELFSIVAQELKLAGVNVNLGPVCDTLYTPDNKAIGDRSFGTDEETVSKNISAVIRGQQTNGIISCAKHFPGHGRVIPDSHDELPVDNSSIEDLENADLKPFVKAIKSKVDMVMTSHIKMLGLDDQNPVSLSFAWMKYLRTQLRYKGIIITDDMEMGAITDHYGLKESACLAIGNGADLIEYRHSRSAMEAYEGLKLGLRSKELKKNLLHSKIARIEELKKEKLANFHPAQLNELRSFLNNPERKEFLTNLNHQINN